MGVDVAARALTCLLGEMREAALSRGPGKPSRLFKTGVPSSLLCAGSVTLRRWNDGTGRGPFLEGAPAQE